jgi:hypothetical protein
MNVIVVCVATVGRGAGGRTAGATGKIDAAMASIGAEAEQRGQGCVAASTAGRSVAQIARTLSRATTSRCRKHQRCVAMHFKQQTVFL